MLITKILNNRYTPAKRWSNRKYSTGLVNLKKKIRNILSLLSGNEIVNMIIDVLTKNELRDISHRFVDSLKGIAKTFNNNVKSKQKHRFIRPLRLAGLSRNEVKELGFKCGIKLWRDCYNTNERLVGGRPCLQETIHDEIEKHLEILSSFGANRIISKRVIGPYLPIAGKFNGTKKPKQKRFIVKNIIPVKYLNSTNKEITKTFNEKNEEKLGKKLSYSTIYKNIHKKYKRAKRLTDLCPYCEKGKELKQNVIHSIRARRIEQSQLDLNNFNTKNLLNLISNYLKQENLNDDDKLLYEKILDDLNHINEIEYHRQIANRQKEEYNRMKTDLGLFDDAILIELDYKQKIVYGLAPRATSEQYYSQKQASCLGFGIYFKINEKIKCLNIDIVSDHLEQDAYAVIRAYEYLQNLDFFQERFNNIRKFLIWSDCGTQFRCKELNYYYFTTLAEKGISVNLNYFGEKHGKFSRDQHFSILTQCIRRESIRKWIRSSSDIVNIINESQINSNFFRSQSNKEEIETYAFVLNPDSNHGTITKKVRKINNLKCFYNLRNVLIDGELYLNSTVYSDSNRYIDPSFLDSVISDEKVTINYEGNQEISFDELNIDSNLKQKRQKIEIFLSSTTPHPTPTKILHDSTEKNIEIRRPVFDTANDSTISLRPDYCTTVCENCKSKVLFSVEQLNTKNGNKNLIGQLEINEELSRHSHPKSRKINQKLRTTDQARVELIDHYKYSHKINF